MEKTIYVNRPASRTWNRLGVNEAAVRWDTDAETLLSNERFTAISGKNAPLRIEAADGGAAYGRRVYTVTAEAGAELTVFEVCTAAQPLAVELRLTAAEGAHLRVVQLLNPTRGAVLRHELSAQLAEHAKLDLISSSSATALFTPTIRSPLRATARRCAPTSATSPAGATRRTLI